MAVGPERSVRYRVADLMTKLLGDHPTQELADDLIAVRVWFNKPSNHYVGDIHTEDGIRRLVITREGE